MPWHKAGVFGAFCYSFVTRAVFRVVFRALEDARRRPQKDALPDGGGRLHRKAAPRPGGSSAALAESLVPEAGDPPRGEARGLHRDDAQQGMKEVKSERPRVLLQGVNNPSRARADTFPRVHVLGCRSISLYIHISKFWLKLCLLCLQVSVILWQSISCSATKRVNKYVSNVAFVYSPRRHWCKHKPGHGVLLRLLFTICVYTSQGSASSSFRGVPPSGWCTR